MKAIQTNSLTKYYGRHRGIEDVCLTVEEGDFFGFIGPKARAKARPYARCSGCLLPREAAPRFSERAL